MRTVDASGASVAAGDATPDGFDGGAAAVVRTLDGTLTVASAVTATGNLLLQAAGAGADRCSMRTSPAPAATSRWRPTATSC
ncbi:hypothetical protein HK414_15775 [Ramlibacter terrae]|uniref:Uncharacterized protein n=1 Tax=Ramlibacter terrae TaxID=2732511 RepID=A0ABX6P4Y2_9BURK|nr:hypothetical protein HK414_15775 [Ramlibacter terrae]